MSRRVSESARAVTAESVLVFCRNHDRRAQMERALPAARLYASAMEGTLAVARDRPETVVVDIEDVPGHEADLLRALCRARKDVRIYIMAPAHLEPLARGLTKSGAAGYVIVPEGMDRLASLIWPPAICVAAGGTGVSQVAASDDTGGTPVPPAAPPDRWQSLSEASNSVASLAPYHADSILREAMHILAEATGAWHASIFTYRGGSRDLVMRETTTARSRQNGRLATFEQTCAARCAESEQSLFFPVHGVDNPSPGSAATRPGPEGRVSAPVVLAMLAAIPMSEGAQAVGAVCLLCAAEDCPAPEAWQPVVRIVDGLTALYVEALKREKY